MISDIITSIVYLSLLFYRVSRKMKFLLCLRKCDSGESNGEFIGISCISGYTRKRDTSQPL